MSEVPDSLISKSSNETAVDDVSSDRSYTFWRFMIQIPLGPCEMKVVYNVNNGPPTDFWVPALDQNMRWAAYSVSPRRETYQYLRSPFNPSLAVYSATDSLLESIQITSADLVFSQVTTPFGRT